MYQNKQSYLKKNGQGLEHNCPRTVEHTKMLDEDTFEVTSPMPHFTQEGTGSERFSDMTHVIQPVSTELIPLYLDNHLQRSLYIKCKQKKIKLRPSPFRPACVAPGNSSPRALEKQRDIPRLHLHSWLQNSRDPAHLVWLLLQQPSEAWEVRH